MFVSMLQLGLSTLDTAQTCTGWKSHSKSKSLFQFVVLSELNYFGLKHHSTITLKDTS